MRQLFANVTSHSRFLLNSLEEKRKSFVQELEELTFLILGVHLIGVKNSGLSGLSGVSTLNLPTNLRDFLYFYTIIQFLFGRIKVATPCQALFLNSKSL